MIESYFIHTAIWTRETKDSFGKVTSTTEQTIGCFIKPEQKVITDVRGNEVVSMAKVFTNPSSGISILDTLTINGVRRRVINIQTKTSFNQHMDVIDVA